MSDEKKPWGYWANKNRKRPDPDETYSEKFTREQEERERLERVNGRAPHADPYCDCGAKFERGFENIHSPFCRAFKNLNEWKK